MLRRTFRPSRVSHSMTIRVPDCAAAYGTLVGRGAAFLTPPVASEWEVRAFFRDPDGHLYRDQRSPLARGFSASGEAGRDRHLGPALAPSDGS